MATKEEVKIWSDYPTLGQMEFNTKITRRRELSALVKQAEAELDELNKDLQAAMVVSGVSKVLWNGMVASIRGGRSAAKIDGKLLVTNGVDADVVKECTVPGTAYSYFFLDDPENRTKKEAARDGDAA